VRGRGAGAHGSAWRRGPGRSRHGATRSGRRQRRRRRRPQVDAGCPTPYPRLPSTPALLPATALLILGSICFLPGAYHTRVAYLAWRGVEGYSVADIPDC
jgi:hypothetical protein